MSGTEGADHKANMMISLVDGQPDAITGCCTGCKWEYVVADDQEVYIHYSRAYLDEYEPVNKT